MIPEKGDFSQIPVPGLLLHVAESGLTGILYLKLGDTLKALHFDGGRLVWAISNSVEDKLERILQENRLVDELELNRIRRQKSGAALGKALVEKGLLTVEQLVDCTRQQFKRILDDVLSWTRGGYQVIESPPPENLFKMDLDVVSMVFNYILENVGIQQVEERIPDLTLCPESRADEARLAALNLSQKKLEFLSHFDGRQNVQEILARYADSHREALLKVVYFFILADLVRFPGEPGPLEVPVNESSPAEEPPPPAEPVILPEASELPSLEEMEARAASVDAAREPEVDTFPVHTPVETAQPVLDLDVEAAEPQPDFYSFTTESGDEGEELEISTSRPAEPMDVDAMLRTEKASRRSGRQVNLLLILVVAILVTGGAIFLLLMSGESEAPVPARGSAGPTAQADAPGSPAIPVQGVTEKTPEQQAAAVTGKPESLPAGKTVRTPVQAESPLRSARKQSLELLRKKRYREAATLWRSSLGTDMSGYSILLEMDCLTASVGNAFRRIHDPDQFFLLPRDRGGRVCFLVLWGHFKREPDARAALSGLPPYFLNQDPPAKVVDLAAYR